MRDNHFVFLFAGLLAMLAAEPVIESIRPHSSLVQLAFSLTLVIGVWSLVDRKRIFQVGLLLTGVTVLTSVWYAASGNVEVQMINLVAVAVFCGLTIVLAFQQVVLRGGGDVTLNQLMGALCIYLLIGTLWSTFYAFVEFIQPNAFHYPTVTGERHDIVSEFLYFSFITLTTLGYGDLTPVHPVARTLAYLEAVVGQLFLAVLVASMVGRFIGGRYDADWQSDQR